MSFYEFMTKDRPLRDIPRALFAEDAIDVRATLRSVGRGISEVTGRTWIPALLTSKPAIWTALKTQSIATKTGPALARATIGTGRYLRDATYRSISRVTTAIAIARDTQQEKAFLQADASAGYELRQLSATYPDFTFEQQVHFGTSGKVMGRTYTTNIPNANRVEGSFAKILVDRKGIHAEGFPPTPDRESGLKIVRQTVADLFCRAEPTLGNAAPSGFLSTLPMPQPSEPADRAAYDAAQTAFRKNAACATEFFDALTTLPGFRFEAKRIADEFGGTEKLTLLTNIPAAGGNPSRDFARMVITPDSIKLTGFSSSPALSGTMDINHLRFGLTAARKAAAEAFPSRKPAEVPVTLSSCVP